MAVSVTLSINLYYPMSLMQDGSLIDNIKSNALLGKEIDTRVKVTKDIYLHNLLFKYSKIVLGTCFISQLNRLHVIITRCL